MFTVTVMSQPSILTSSQDMIYPPLTLVRPTSISTVPTSIIVPNSRAPTGLDPTFGTRSAHLRHF